LFWIVATVAKHERDYCREQEATGEFVSFHVDSSTALATKLFPASSWMNTTETQT
jgi:hypothetical protein